MIEKMTMRDRFASYAMKSLLDDVLKRELAGAEPDSDSESTMRAIARTSYALADAMMMVRSASGDGSEAE